MARSYLINMSIIDIFHKMENGGILSPNFNRGFVWNKKIIKRLIESIYKGYPIGMILAVEGDSDQFERTESDISHFPKTDDYSSYQYSTLWVIDGSQRLASLYGVLKSSSLNLDLYFDLFEREFLFKPKNENKNRTIKVSDLFNPGKFMDFQENLISNVENAHLMSVLNDIHKRFQYYSVAVQIISDVNNDEVIDIFTSLNMSGQSLKKTDLEKARSYKNLTN